MIVLGHERTEEWGMKYMADWLKPLVKGIPVTFISADEPFGYITKFLRKQANKMALLQVNFFQTPLGDRRLLTLWYLWKGQMEHQTGP